MASPPHRLSAPLAFDGEVERRKGLGLLFRFSSSLLCLLVSEIVLWFAIMLLLVVTVFDGGNTSLELMLLGSYEDKEGLKVRGVSWVGVPIPVLVHICSLVKYCHGLEDCDRPPF